MAELRLAGVVRESFADGPGIRFTVFTQGCSHNCAGCHNPQTHSPDGGYMTTTEKLLCEIDKDPLLSGVTISGGEPFMQAAAVAELVQRVRERAMNVITYTGYTMEELLEGLDAHPDWHALLEATDLLVDGRFVLELRNPSLRFRGSSNQRVIDAAASLRENRPVQTDWPNNMA